MDSVVGSVVRGFVAPRVVEREDVEEAPERRRRDEQRNEPPGGEVPQVAAERGGDPLAEDGDQDDRGEGRESHPDRVYRQPDRRLEDESGEPPEVRPK